MLSLFPPTCAGKFTKHFPGHLCPGQGKLSGTVIVMRSSKKRAAQFLPLSMPPLLFHLCVSTLTSSVCVMLSFLFFLVLGFFSLLSVGDGPFKQDKPSCATGQTALKPFTGRNWTVSHGVSPKGQEDGRLGENKPTAFRPPVFVQPYIVQYDGMAHSQWHLSERALLW